MKTIPFDRAIAKEHPERIITRGGKKLNFYHDSGFESPFPIIGIIQGANKYYTSWNKLGCEYIGLQRENDLLLITDECNFSITTEEFTDIVNALIQCRMHDLKQKLIKQFEK